MWASTHFNGSTGRKACRLGAGLGYAPHLDVAARYPQDITKSGRKPARIETRNLLRAKGRGERGGYDLLKGRLISWLNARFFLRWAALDSKSESAGVNQSGRARGEADCCRNELNSHMARLHGSGEYLGQREQVFLPARRTRVGPADRLSTGKSSQVLTPQLCRE